MYKKWAYKKKNWSTQMFSEIKSIKGFLLAKTFAILTNFAGSNMLKNFAIHLLVENETICRDIFNLY